MRNRIGLALAVALAGCATTKATSQPATASAAGAGALPFIEDDYARAAVEARASKRPIFVDAWAPW